MNTIIGLTLLTVAVLIVGAVIATAPKNTLGRAHSIAYVAFTVLSVAVHAWAFVLLAMAYGFVATAVQVGIRRRVKTA